MSTRTVAITFVTLLVWPIAALLGATVEKEMGPQVFAEPSVESVGANDSVIVSAVDSAVAAAQKYQFYYDASKSPDGRVVVKALWKGDPVTLTMRFFRKEGAVYIASSLTQSGALSLKRRGETIEKLFYSQLLEETKRRGLEIYGDPTAIP